MIEDIIYQKIKSQFTNKLKPQFKINKNPDTMSIFKDIYSPFRYKIYCHWYKDEKYKNIDFNAIHQKDGSFEFEQSSKF